MKTLFPQYDVVQMSLFQGFLPYFNNQKVSLVLLTISTAKCRELSMKVFLRMRIEA